MLPLRWSLLYATLVLAVCVDVTFLKTKTIDVNECQPKIGCNVCSQCCEDYIKDGPPCDSCVKSKCVDSHNQCNPAKHCNVCRDCCKSYIQPGDECDKCVHQNCAVPKPPCGGLSINISAAQCEAFQEMFDSTNGNYWSMCSKSRNDPCSCNSVVCSDDATDITEIYLMASNLTGSLPEQLSELTALTELDMYSNNLTGTVPDLRGLNSLKHLVLASNDLSGPLPQWIGTLSSLTDLHLALNKFSGRIPSNLARLTGLEDLSISSNLLTGPIPASFVNLTKLDNFYVNGNKLDGKVPPMLFKNITGDCLLNYGNPPTNHFVCELPADAAEFCNGVCVKKDNGAAK